MVSPRNTSSERSRLGPETGVGGTIEVVTLGIAVALASGDGEVAVAGPAVTVAGGGGGVAARSMLRKIPPGPVCWPG